MQVIFYCRWPQRLTPSQTVRLLQTSPAVLGRLESSGKVKSCPPAADALISWQHPAAPTQVTQHTGSCAKQHACRSLCGRQAGSVQGPPASLAVRLATAVVRSSAADVPQALLRQANRCPCSAWLRSHVLLTVPAALSERCLTAGAVAAPRPATTRQCTSRLKLFSTAHAGAMQAQHFVAVLEVNRSPQSNCSSAHTRGAFVRLQRPALASGLAKTEQTPSKQSLVFLRFCTRKPN